MNSPDEPVIRAGMVGFGMIFDDTYRPFFERCSQTPLFSPSTGPILVPLVAAATRTGHRVAKYLRNRADRPTALQNFAGPDAVPDLLAAGVDAVCIATPDDRHFQPAQ